MYSIDVTGEEPRVVHDETEVIRFALEIAAAYGPYFGMEDWGTDSMKAWMNIQLNDAGRMDLHVSGPETIDFVARREEY